MFLAQNSKMAKEVYTLINEARTSPASFLDKYRSNIEKYNPKHLQLLSKAQPIETIKWDDGLEIMGKAVIENGNLNPIYKGNNLICGKSSIRGSKKKIADPLEIVCYNYLKVHSKDYKYIGLYFNASNTDYSLQWGRSCNREKIKFSYTEKIDTSKVNFRSLNTAANSNYMDVIEKKMMLEINFVRAYPKIYAKIVMQYLASKSKSIFGLDNETYSAGIELINELNDMTPLLILQPKKCLYNAVKLHGLYCKKRGFFNHTGRDGSRPRDRIIKQCPNFENGGENGAGSTFTDVPRNILIGLLIDAGITYRGHRKNILNNRVKYAASFKYGDPKYSNIWIQNFAY